MAATTKTAVVIVSNRFSLIWADGLKGLTTAVITAVLTVIYQALTNTPVVFNWKQIAIVGATAGVGYLLKNFFSNTVTLAKSSAPGPTSNVVKTILLIVAASLLSKGASSQISSSFFGHLHYKQTAKHAHAIGLAPDSTYTGLRPTATAAIGYDSKGGTSVLAFAGFGYFHVTRSAATGSYYTDYGISLQIGTGASNGGVSLANATTLGLFGQFFNSLLTIGIGYNFNNRSVLPLVGPGIAFH